jgi:DNA-binding beta-propeller fold protein YncE
VGIAATVPAHAASEATIPDGRTIAPAGFTVPVESFVTDLALSPDGALLAALSVDGHAVDVIDTKASVLVDRLALDAATGLAWTPDGLYVAQGYTGRIARFTYGAPAKKKATGSGFARRTDLDLGPGLINGIAEDAATHRLAIARTGLHEVVVADDTTDSVTARYAASGEPFDVAFAGSGVVATLYDRDHVDAWDRPGAAARRIRTGPHPTRLLATGGRVFVADADGHDVVALDGATLRVLRTYDLSVTPGQPPGQTPAGMALDSDGKTLYVAESGFNDVAMLDLDAGTVSGRIPTGWYPTAVATLSRPTVGAKDARAKRQLWIASAKGLGSQPDPAGEWNGTYTGLVQHLVVDPSSFAGWSATVARNDGFDAATESSTSAIPAVKHIVVVVRENKQFDEEFGDEPQANADPSLLLYGRKFTPNIHALAERYTMFDNFMSDGEASIYGHAWLTQGMANDYHERNARERNDAGVASPQVAWSIWPYPLTGPDDALPSAQMDFDWFQDLDALPAVPRINTSGVFGPRGELIDELQRRGVSYRVYGEQMTMLPSGKIAAGLAAHADRAYPGDHIDFGVRDTVRAKLFLDDVAAHGLAHYSYLTLPTDHTAGTRPGLLTPASFVADNDVALGEIIAGLSKRPEWRDTVVFVTPDDAQGTGDHLDAHRMPVFAVGPYVRRGYVDHEHLALPSILRTVELAFGLQPLNIYDAGARPVDAFATQPEAVPYDALAANIPIVENPGKATADLSFEIDGPESADIPRQEWLSIKGPQSLAAHEAYLERFGQTMVADDR